MNRSSFFRKSQSDFIFSASGRIGSSDFVKTTRLDKIHKANFSFLWFRFFRYVLIANKIFFTKVDNIFVFALASAIISKLFNEIRPCCNPIKYLFVRKFWVTPFFQTQIALRRNPPKLTSKVCKFGENFCFIKCCFELIWSETGFKNGVAPTRPKFSKPLGLLYSRLIFKFSPA